MNYHFEWNPNKANQNKKKHKISFERASQIFLDPFQISILDKEHSEVEERWITIGKENQETLIVVIHTFLEIDNEYKIRIISARKATKRETKQYENF